MLHGKSLLSENAKGHRGAYAAIGAHTIGVSMNWGITSERCLALSCQVEDTRFLRLGNSTLRYTSLRNVDMCSKMFIAAMFVIVVKKKKRVCVWGGGNILKAHLQNSE